MPKRFVAPAGAPIRPADLVRWGATLASSGDAAQRLERAVAARVGASDCRVVATGRAGMTLIARALGRLSSRHEIVIPSYTCYSVAASVVKAGLRPRVADINPATLDYDYDRLEVADLRGAAAILATNLYGLPNDMQRLRRVADANGLHVIDDAAQALGARIAGRWCGTGGDVGLYSFDKGKNVSAIDGGAIVTSSPRITAAIDAEVSALPGAGVGALVHALVKLGAYVTLLPPSMYWIPAGIPQLGLGTTVYTTEFALERHPRTLAALALTMMARLDEFTNQRRTNASDLIARLRSIPGITLITPVEGAEPAYLRLPVLLPTRTLRDAAIGALARTGIGASASYPTSIADIPELKGVAAGIEDQGAGGRIVAERILTLPTHPYVTDADRDRIAAVLRAVLIDAPVVAAYPAAVHQS